MLLKERSRMNWNGWKVSIVTAMNSLCWGNIMRDKLERLVTDHTGSKGHTAHVWLLSQSRGMSPQVTGGDMIKSAFWKGHCFVSWKDFEFSEIKSVGKSGQTRWHTTIIPALGRLWGLPGLHARPCLKEKESTVGGRINYSKNTLKEHQEEIRLRR
jgi:hypothetical protein